MKQVEDGLIRPFEKRGWVVRRTPDGRCWLFFGWVRRVHPRFRTPAWAIAAQAVWASGFALSGTFRQIVTYTAFPNYFFLSLGVVALLVLRVREPDLERPYRVFAYPLTPLLFLGVFAWYLVNSVVFEFRDTMVGIVMALSGLPFYFLWFRRGGAGRG